MCTFHEFQEKGVGIFHYELCLWITLELFVFQGLNTALFYENKNPKEYISLVPTSAHSGDGMGNLIALICELCQTLLAKRLAFSEELQATAMEVSILNIKKITESAFEYSRS